MRPVLFMAALAAATCLALPATAVTFTAGAPNTGPQPKGSGDYSLYADFNSGAPSNLTGGSIRSGSNDSLYAQPFNDPTPYYSVGPEAGSPATLTLSNFDVVSLYWGSIDQYNTIAFLGPNNTVLQSFMGSDIDNAIPATGPKNSRNVTFSLSPTEKSLVTGIRFSSSINAFEFDNLAVSSAPEPAVWATMILGFGMAGASLRRRKPSQRSTPKPA